MELSSQEASPRWPDQAGYGAATAGVALALLSAVLAALSLPPYPVWPLVFVAFVPMLVAQHRILPPRWAALAPGITIGLYFGSQMLRSLREAGVPFVVQLLPLYAGLMAAALAWRSRRFHEQTGYRWFFLATPAAWVAIDFLRGSGVAVLGGTWGNPAYALWSQAPLIQPVSIFGTYGLELLILVVNWSIAGMAIAALDRSGRPHARTFALRRAAGPLAGCAVAAAAWTVLSFSLDGGPRVTVRVAAVQPGPGGSSAEELRRDVEQTREAARAGARLVVCREGGVGFDPRRQRTSEFTALARETGVYLVVGFSARLPDGKRQNMAAVFSPDGQLVGSYGKDHAGTFAGDFSDVRLGHPVWRTAIGGLAVIICYDLDFTDTARAMARGGAQIIAVPSNDPVPSLAETHYTHLVFRAIENRLSLIKADRMRDAAAVDPWGRVAGKIIDRQGRRSTLIADLPPGTGQSPYVRLGDWAGWLATAVSASFVILSSIGRRRRAPAGEAG